ncbi:CRISPR-associated protein Cas5 [Alkalinema pantanalense CENA528]|uniref:CRISPR-associated protein Cas5 n=1 Tax=Alkalinema pantanalense TaxID=1620705 RepID=UPI003D6F0872
MFLRLQAPFAAFRPFQSGGYRSTTPIPSPSTIYGLLLNLAAIEQRAELTTPVTLMRENLPEMEIAIAQVKQPELAILSQQLHQYPVGASGAELAKKTYGAKYWIAPVRREVLVNLDIVVGIKAEQELCNRILAGLNGELEDLRYGLPFAGDNNFLFNIIKPANSLDDLVVGEEKSFLLRWYSPITSGIRPQPGVCRLTTWIDRSDNSKTEITVFAPGNFCRTIPPDNHPAWIQLPGQSCRNNLPNLDNKSVSSKPKRNKKTK